MTDQTVGLTDNDIASVLDIIDVCVKRGAFEGKEMFSVGAIRNKFEAFLEHVRSAPKVEEYHYVPEADEEQEGLQEVRD